MELPSLALAGEGFSCLASAQEVLRFLNGAEHRAEALASI